MGKGVKNCGQLKSKEKSKNVLQIHEEHEDEKGKK